MMAIVAFLSVPKTVYMELASHQTSASVNQDTGARYAITNVHLENGVNLAKWIVCARTEQLVIHSTVNACVPEVGPVYTVVRNVLLTDTDKIVAKSVVAGMVEVVIIFLASAIVLLAIQDHFAMISVHPENTAMNANQSASVRMVVLAILQLANAIVHVDGLVQSVRTGVQKVFGVKTVLKSAIVTMELAVIISLENVNVNLAIMMKSA